MSANAGFHAVTGGVAPRLLRPPVSVPRLLLDPDGLAPRNPSADLRELAAELVGPVPPRPTTNQLGFAVPLRLRTGAEELRLITTLTHFGTAVDVTIAELRLEAFLPADEATATALAGIVPRQSPPGDPAARA